MHRETLKISICSDFIVWPIPCYYKN